MDLTPAPDSGRHNLWRDYEYLITVEAGGSALDRLPSRISCKMIIELRGLFACIAQADAMLAALDDVRGFHLTSEQDLFQFDFWCREELDDWLAQHPKTQFLWIEQFVVAFADQETKRQFDTSFGGRILERRRLFTGENCCK